MKKNQSSGNKIKILLTAIFMIFFIILVTGGTKIVQSVTDTYVVAEGALSYEEPAEGYIIRNELVMQGENYKNGMVQVVSDKERASKSQIVFRYYSCNENSILEQISKIDSEINEIIENTGFKMDSSGDIIILEREIENTLYDMRGLNNLQRIDENKNKIEACMSKKTQITAILSPSNSYLKQLTEKKERLEKELETGSEIVTAPSAGMVSYRVDGLEEILKCDNFDYLTTELLDSFELKVGSIVLQNKEKGKLVNNFEGYIATSIDTEMAKTAKVGDKVSIRLPNSSEIDAEIVYIKDEEINRIIVFKIKNNISELLDYRKISFDIIWWKYKGWKISNSCILENNDITYVQRNTAGYTEKIPVMILRQNDTYSIVRNYEKEELVNLGYTDEQISSMGEIRLYDEILSY